MGSYVVKIVDSRNVVKFLDNTILYRSLYDNLRDCAMTTGMGFDEYASHLIDILVDKETMKRQLVVLLAKPTPGTVLASSLLSHSPIYNRSEVQSVCVGTGHRGEGLCKSLMKEVLRVSKADGVRSVDVSCHSKNAPARACYTSIFGKPFYVTKKTCAFSKLM